MEGIWPLVVIWVLFALFGSKKKPKGAAAPPPLERAAPEGDVSDRFAQAMAELKQAEAEAQRKAANKGEAEAQARRYLAEQKRKVTTRSARATAPVVVAPKPAGPQRGVKRPVRPLESDAEEMSSEVVTAEGVADYDEEAAEVAAARIRAAERRPSRSDEAAGELSAAQRARRADRPAVAIGGKAEHATWHEDVRGLPPPAVVARAERPDLLRRWADGSLRGAIILSEVFGRPVGER